MTEAGKKLFIKTYGCQMNVYDSERMAEAAQAAGYLMADNEAAADLVILNTCHIRDKAVEKVYSDLGRLRKLKSQAGQSDKIIGVAGCVAQAEGEEIMRRAPLVDFVMGPQSYHELPALLQEHREGGKPVATSFAAKEKFPALPKRSEPQSRPHQSRSAFLTIQEGCDKFCTFCVVPYTRGAEYSRPVGDILDEARTLAGKGVRELTLLGQNVNAYLGESPQGQVSLAGLLTRLSEISGVERLRYTTSHPNDMTDDLMEAHRDLPKLMPYLHLPIQSGSDAILSAMNRKHSVADYLSLIDRLRRYRSDLALSSDFIVGFPGETDSDFAATMKLAKDVGFASAYSFKYSPRPGTPASNNPSQIEDKVKSDRLACLQDQLESDRRRFNQSCLERTLPILLEKEGRREGQLIGRSPYLQAAHVFLPPDMIGAIVPLKVVGVGATSLQCQVT